MSLPIHSSPAENDPTYHPIVITAKHVYNLSNQSWGVPRSIEVSPGTYAIDDPIDKYNTDLSLYPSNAETVYIGLQFQPVDVATVPFERLFPSLFKEKINTDAKAAKGYFIIDLLDRGVSREEAYAANLAKYSELTSYAMSLPEDSTGGGAAVVQTYAGRIFYAGFTGEVANGDARSPSLTNMICFSQVVRNRQDFVKCYQEGDPTSREGNEIVDTDGGFLKIAEAKQILAMAVLAKSLIVFATNGVWAISGGSEIGFSASNYKVDKISDQGIISKHTVVSNNSSLFYWANNGIHKLSKNQFGDIVSDSLSENTIQTLYDNIPLVDKQLCQVVYEAVGKTIRWFYPSGEDFLELIFHTKFNAFTVNKLFADDPDDPALKLAGIFTPTKSSQQRYVVISPSESDFSLLSFADFKRDDFKDWGVVDAAGFILTGGITGNDTSLPKQAPYLTMHFEKTEDGVDVDGVPLHQSSCLVRSQWDWANSILSKKFGTVFQAYRHRRALFTEGSFDNGFDVVTSKSKLRGRGKTFSLHLSTEEGKDCRILGWNLSLNANTVT